MVPTTPDASVEVPFSNRNRLSFFSYTDIIINQYI